MLTYKGSNLLKGKHFIMEHEGKNKKVEYLGKVYGNHHLFSDGIQEFVLTENETSNLKNYTKLLEHSLLQEQDNEDDLYQLVTSYTDKQLNIINNGPSNKLWSSLTNSFQEELNKLADLGLAYQTTKNKIEGNESYLLEVIMDYLEDVQRNISETSLPNHYSQLTNFIYNISRLGGDK